MNTDEINRILRVRCGGTFLGTFASDRLPARLPPKRPLFLVCNTDPHTRRGQHWIAMFIDKDGRGEYFDSLHQDALPAFARYLDERCVSWKTNSRQLQSAASRFCGQYCVFYCMFRNLDFDLARIESCFTEDTGVNDAFVHGIICQIIKF